jgi:hypothetical protein
MAASSNNLLAQEESKEDHFDDDVAPREIMILPPSLLGLVANYAWEAPLEKPFLFAGCDYLLEKILFLSEHAGPLDQFERYVTKFLGREITNKTGRESVLLDDPTIVMGKNAVVQREGTFAQCLAIGLDTTIRKMHDLCLISRDIEEKEVKEDKMYVQAKSDGKLHYVVKTALGITKGVITAAEIQEKSIPRPFNDEILQRWKLKILNITSMRGHTPKDGIELSEGRTERFIKIVENFCKKGLLPPEKLQAVKRQVENVSPPEDEKEKAKRKDAARQLFEGFIDDKKNTDDENVKKTDQAMETFKKFVEMMKLASMNNEKKDRLTDNRYSIGLIHLMDECIDILVKRGGELTDGWYGKKGDLFCYKMIGEFLQTTQWVPARVRQIFGLKYGLYSLFYENKKPDHTRADVTGTLYREPEDGFVIGVNSFYGDFGHGVGDVAGRLRGVLVGRAFHVFNTYYKQLHQHPDIMHQQRPIHRTPSICPIM